MKLCINKKENYILIIYNERGYERRLNRVINI